MKKTTILGILFGILLLSGWAFFQPQKNPWEGMATGTGGYYNSTGGSVTYDGNYTVVTFTSNGTFNWTGTGFPNVEVLVVAGGAGGGAQGGGGGGAGGVIHNMSYNVTVAIAVVVGTGGTGAPNTGSTGSNGKNSSFGTLNANGGGGGGSEGALANGLNGGSGGGGSYYNGVGGSATPAGQGYNGGAGKESHPTYRISGGGGGANQTGLGFGTATRGYGGNGSAINISGTATYYGGGGGGGGWVGYGTNYGNGSGGLGGGGTGGLESSVPTAGAANSGGGGGGGGTGAGANGGSGIVIIKYLTYVAPTYGNLTVNYTTGGTATGSNSTFTPPANLTIVATANSGYYFVNWTKTTGNCTFLNASNATTNVSVLDFTLCSVTATFFSFPVISALSTSPASPTKATNLSANITVSDTTPTYNVSFNWSKNGAIQAGLAGFVSVANNTAKLISNLTSGNFSKGENWSVSAIACNANGCSPLNVSANVTIGNSAPSNTSIGGFINGTNAFNATGTAYDLDGGSDIVSTNCSTSVGTCAYVSNSSSGTQFTVQYYFETSVAGTTNLTICFIDGSGASACANSTYEFPITLVVDYGPGITALKFRPINAFQSGVAAVNQTTVIPLYVVTNGFNYTRNLTAQISSAIPGFDMYLSAYANGANPVHLNTTPQTVSQIAPKLSGTTYCLQPDAQSSMSCGAVSGGSYNDNGSAWHDDDWNTSTTLSDSAIYSSTYLLSSYVNNSSAVIKYGNSSAATNATISTFLCLNNATSMQMRYVYTNASFGNSEDGALVFTTGSKSYGNLVNSTDYNVSGDTLYLRLDRPYNFSTFILGAGTTLSTQSVNGTAMIIRAKTYLHLNGTANLSGILTTSYSAGYSFEGTALKSIYVQTGGNGGHDAYATGGIGSSSGYGGGGAGGSSTSTVIGGSGADGGAPAGNGGAALCYHCGSNFYALRVNGTGGTVGSAGGSGSAYFDCDCGIGHYYDVCSGTGANSYGGNATPTGGSGYLCSPPALAGAGGSGGSKGTAAPNLYLASPIVVFNGIIDLHGLPGNPGGNGTGSTGGGGGGGGGGDAGDVIVYYTNFSNTGTVNMTSGLGGAAGTSGASTTVVATAGTSGTTGTQASHQTGFQVWCYYGSAWNLIYAVSPNLATNKLYEAQVNWTLVDQFGTQNLWGWANFNNPSPRAQGFNVSINGVDP